MDERVREHAEVLIGWSARVEEGDDVVLSVGPDAHDLAVAVAEKLGERGANLLATYSSGEVTRAYLREYDGEFDEPAHERALYEHADVVLSLGGGRNTSAMADVSGDTRQTYDTARAGVREARFDTRWVSTIHPTRALAQQANMAYEEYRDFAYDAILRDWESLAEEMGRMKDVLDGGSEVRLVSGGTDLSMQIDDRTAVNSAASVAYDSHNLPSGEVFTAPYATEGEVTFDVPMTIRGEPVRDVRLEFADGEVVDYDAEQGGEVIEAVLETDDGARRLGELGIGMNRGIDRYTDTILFDEKMGDTVHLALGRAYDACLPTGESGNESAVHVDLITDVSEDSRLEVDGETVQRDGRFRWEDGFEG
ncbi:aminopeptidase [Natrarchaeobaculum sulfurireducens]|uniref:Leucyl aminopeptidase (Aminopeptidase T) n=1 Tax=Natrarchaeobaculum sulfurireducens TaxID=2044521 RepID=A0A346PAG4_9EURY|nr:aminopeptidase [Natrarchaeobaculum sulfurireducens]AXR76509.1 Leucyl aminopeptidase (aminopeptidase T) [Natrarchaeobaculum sulfurireducens]